MLFLKLAFCATLALGSAAAFLLLRGRPAEVRFYRRAVLLASAAKVAGCVLLYTFAPQLNLWSDATRHYLPQTLRVLAGQVPYRDFESSYSPLFQALLAGPVSLWSSVGAVVLTMLALDFAALWIYVRRPGADPVRTWRAAFLYSLSPVAVYWVAVTGYNGPAVALAAVAALVLAERGRPWLAGTVAALGFLSSKLLAVLFWPGVAAWSREGFWKRTLPMALSLAAVLLLPLAGFDTLQPVRREALTVSTGNLWSLLRLAAPGVEHTLAWKVLPPLAFLAAFAALFLAFQRKGDARPEDRFDTSAALIAATSLAFMLLSRKSYTIYAGMFLLLAVHTLARDGRTLLRHLPALTWLGGVTTLEVDVAELWKQNGDAAGILFAIDLLLVLAYLDLLAGCTRAALARVARVARATPPSGPTE